MRKVIDISQSVAVQTTTWGDPSAKSLHKRITLPHQGLVPNPKGNKALKFAPLDELRSKTRCHTICCVITLPPS